MVKVDELVARVQELKNLICEQTAECNKEAETTAATMGWNESFAADFSVFLYEKKYKTKIEKEQQEYDILKKFIVEE